MLVKYIKFFLLILCLAVHAEKNTTVTVQAQHYKKTPVMLVVSPDLSQETVKALQEDLQVTGSLDPVISKDPVSKKLLHSFYSKGYPLAVCITKETDTKKHIKYAIRVYETRNKTMISGHACIYDAAYKSFLGHVLSDIFLPTLLGKPTVYASNIAYIKKTKHNYQLCVADSTGNHERVLVESPYKLFGVRWCNNGDNPLVLYSEVTPINVRLCGVDKHKKQQVITSFEGINMLPTFSEDGTSMYISLSQSREKGNSQLFCYAYDKHRKKYVYTQLTYHDGNCIAPAVINEHMLIVCSDHENKRPHLYTFDIKTKAMQKITSGGSCYNPSYHKASHKLAYSQMHNGVAQLMVYDMNTQQHTQITDDRNTHKLECSWSPCGTKLVYVQSVGDAKRIAQIDLATKVVTYITPLKQICDFPAWSEHEIVFE